MHKTFQLARKFTAFPAVTASARFAVLRPIIALGIVALGIALSPIALFGTAALLAQTPASDPPVPHRIHLILKDGSYQIVTGYRVKGPNVVYLSAERAGAEEVIPLSLVDLDATHAWEQQHIPGAHPEQKPTGRSTIDPELLKEEADRAALTPEVAPDLNLPEQDSVLALDFFQSTPELVPLAQSAGELNRNTAHNILKSAINPHSSAHGIVELKGFRSAVQLHVADPVLYIRVGDDPSTGGGSTFKVDTQGASGNAPTASAGGSPNSRYVIVRADVRTDSRILASFNLPQLGAARRQEDIVETTSDPLPGGHWLKLTPREPLSFGEYALMEVLNDRDVNLGVWDFGVHPVAPENRDAIKPQPKRPFQLDHRRRE